MQQPATNRIPDESLAGDLLPFALVASVMIAVAACGFMLVWANTASAWEYLLPAVPFVGAWLAEQARIRRNVRAAGMVLAWTYGLLPLASLPLYGITHNYLIYLAPLGVALAALLICADMTFPIARSYALLLVAGSFFFGTTLRETLPPVLAAVVLVFGTAMLSWLAAYSIQGTIDWALETGQKSERREHLLRAAQSDLELSLRERDRLNDSLQHLNADLDAARIAAEAAYRSKSSFMATMSHELRTPLNLIIGFSTAMLDHPEMYPGEPLPQVYRTDVAEIQQSGQHLLQLINDILDLAKVEAGRLELNSTALDIGPLLNDALKAAGGLVKERPLALRRAFAIQLPPVQADEIRIRQVLLNLVSNACKFTPQGEIVLGAQVEEHQLIVWVRDTGIGIAPIDQQRIFGEFEQVEGHDAKQQSGTGLGLSICRWLIELHGGRLWLESEPGKGSTFFFSLPRIELHHNNTATAVSLTTAQGQA